MNKSGDKLLTAQKLSDLEQNSGRMPWKTYAQYVIVATAKGGFNSNVKIPQKNNFQRNTQQNSNAYAMQNQHPKFKSTLYSQYQKAEEIKEQNEKYKNAKGKQIEMKQISNDLKVKHLKEMGGQNMITKVKITVNLNQN